MLTRLFASPLVADNPNWGVGAIAVGGLAVGLALLAWSALRLQQRPQGAGCALLIGILLTPLSFLTLLWSMDLADNMGR